MLSNEPVSRTQAAPRRRWLRVALLLIVLYLIAQASSTLWTELLWYRSVDLSTVWTELLLVRLGLIVAAVAVSFAFVYVNMMWVDRSSVTVVAIEEGEEVVARFQDWVGPRRVRVRLLVAGFLALMTGVGAGSWTYDVVLFLNPQNFDLVDPIFNNDVGFYVFRLPLLRALATYTFQLVALTAVVATFLHFMNGNIRLLANRPPEVVRGARVQLSVLLAAVFLVKAVSYRLDTFELLYSGRGTVAGASFTDVTAQRPALTLLVFVSVAVALVLLLNLRFDGWLLPGIAVGAWLLISIIGGGVVPAVVQQLSVVPDEINKEITYVQHNIDLTRFAFGIDDVETRSFTARQNLAAGDLEANTATLDNLRLWDPAVLRSTYKSSQELRPFYEFEDVDVDRYVIDGELTQVLLSPRELVRPEASDDWINSHLVFTHGFGAVVSQANDVTDEGKPDYLVRDIPPQSNDPILEIDQPRIYFGEALPVDSIVIAGTEEKEIDRPVGEGDDAIEFNSYDGPGGVEAGSLVRRAAFAIRYSDFNIIISRQLNPDSKVLMRRNIVDRVASGAPFLSVDSDPYMVVLDGRLVWVVDLYTTSEWFPYAQAADTGRLRAVGDGAISTDPYLSTRFNYLRNPVKATVDAYTGEMKYYVIDDSDPVLAAYRQAFPELFEDAAEMPTGLAEHFRYPEDMFRVQTDMFKRYHVTGARDFFTDSDRWDIAVDPATSPRDPIRRPVFDSDRRQVLEMEPYYLLIRLPGEDDLSFLMMQPFTPEAKANMIAFLVAKSDPGSYGDLVVYQLPRDRQFDGPALVGQDINQDSAFSALRTLEGQEGSEFIQGQMLVVPIGQSILYVQPIYLQGDSGQIPEFKRVVVAYGDTIGFAETLDQALAQVFPDYVPREQPRVAPALSEPEEPTVLADDVVELLEAAGVAFSEADAALAAGDLGTYQQKVDEAAALIERAQGILADG